MRKIFSILFATVVLCTAMRAQEATRIKLSLSEVFALADKQSHTLLRADYDVQRAKDELSASKMQWMPELSFSVSAGYMGNELLTDRDFTSGQQIDMPHFSNKFSLQLTQTLYDGGMLRSIDKRCTESELASLRFEVNRQDIRFTLSEWYLYYLRLLNLQEVYEKDKSRLKRLLEETSERYKQGTALKSDVTNYRLKVKDAELSLSKNVNRLRIVNYRLVKLLGLPEGTTIEPDDAFLESGTEALHTEAGLVSADESPLLRQSGKTYELSLQDEKFLRAKRWPKLFLWGENNFNGPITTALPPVNKNVNLWGVGIGLSFNIGSIYKSGRSIRAASHSVKMAKEQTALVQDKLTTELYTACTELEEAFDELANRLEYKELAAELYKVMYERYTNGMAIVTEMLDAGNELLSAEVEYLNKRIELFLHYYTLKRIAGTL